MKKCRSNKENKRSFDNLGEYSREAVVINEDLVTEIFLRVPAKSLIRFKCVSKRWRSLISDPIFCSNHAHQNSNPLVSSIYLYSLYHSSQFGFFTIPDRTQSLPKLDYLVDAIIIDYCNGLILFYSCLTGYEVCNPTTRKFKTILPNTCANDSHFMCLTNLVFDPLKSNQYKVVQFLHNCDDDLDEIHIYSSENSSWKSVHITTVAGKYPPTGNKFYWNEALHWLTEDDFHMKFDFDTEELSSTPLRQVTENHKIEYLGSCQRSLILVFCPGSGNPKHYWDRPSFTVLKMESNSNHWIMKYRVQIPPQPMNRFVPNVYSVVYGNNDDEVWLILTQHRNEIELLGSNGKTIQVLMKDKFFSPIGVIQFIETLAPV